MTTALRGRFFADLTEVVSDHRPPAPFLTRREESAFAALVRRHGPMVLGLCRRILGDEHLAEDAFQATFLVLARKGAVVRADGALAGWLYGVARKAALEARPRPKALFTVEHGRSLLFVDWR
jgi:DNA-directed RNA polymerase specialized sigma24 family protein